MYSYITCILPNLVLCTSTYVNRMYSYVTRATILGLWNICKTHNCTAVVDESEEWSSQWTFQFKLLSSNCLNWKIYCHDYSSLSSTTAVQIWISHIFHIISTHGKIWTQQIYFAPNVWLYSSIGRAVVALSEQTWKCWRDNPSSSWRAVTWKVDPKNGIVSWWETNICAYLKKVEAARPPENVDGSWRAVTWKIDPTNGNVSCPFNFTRDQFTSDDFRVNLLSIEKYKHAVSNKLSHILFSCKHQCVFRGDQEPSILLPEHITFNCLRKRISLIQT